MTSYMVVVELLYPKGDNDTNHDNNDADHDNDDIMMAMMILNFLGLLWLRLTA